MAEVGGAGPVGGTETVGVSGATGAVTAPGAAAPVAARATEAVIVPGGPLDPALRAAVEVLLAPGPAGVPVRRLLGLTGPPGAGKSTLSAQIVAAFPGRCVVVPMDGFHLAQAELERLGRADRKGAPDTFDAAGYRALLRRLRAAEPDPVYAPEYRRDLRHGVTGAIAVPPDVPLVVTEGNYLLLAADGFAPVRALLDDCWYLEPPEEVRIERLVRRHVQFGKSPEAARAWVAGTDQRNAGLVQESRARADRVVREVTTRTPPGAAGPPGVGGRMGR